MEQDGTHCCVMCVPCCFAAGVEAGQHSSRYCGRERYSKAKEQEYTISGSLVLPLKGMTPLKPGSMSSLLQDAALAEYEFVCICI